MADGDSLCADRFFTFVRNRIRVFIIDHTAVSTFSFGELIPWTVVLNHVFAFVPVFSKFFINVFKFCQ